MRKDYKDYSELTSFEDVARHYLKEDAPNLKAEMEWFGSKSLGLPEAIERACNSIRENGKLCSHQQRPFSIWPNAAKEAIDILKQLAGSIEAAYSFDDLY